MLNHRDETPMEYAQDTCASPTVYGNATDLTESGPLPTGAGGTMAGSLIMFGSYWYKVLYQRY